MNVPLNALVLVNGGAPAETVLRGMYYPGLMERQYNVRFPIAIAMEDQTLPYGLPSLWAGRGQGTVGKGFVTARLMFRNSKTVTARSITAADAMAAGF